METRFFKTFNTIVLSLVSMVVLAQEGQKVFARDPHEGDRFGSSVSLAANYAIIGAFNASNAANKEDYSGAVYLFKKLDDQWTCTQKIQEGAINTYDSYGYAVDIDTSGYAVVGAYQHGHGTGYIYKIINDSLVKQYQFPQHYGYELGYSVAIDGPNVLVGVPKGNGQGASLSERGEVYLYRLSNSSWTEVQKLTLSDGYDFARFGYSVDLSGDFAVIGAWTASSDYFGASSAHLFKNMGGIWTEVQKLMPSGLDTVTNHFGKSVAIKGEYAFIGAPDEHVTERITGVVYVYKYGDKKWNQIDVLKAPSDVSTSFNFGQSLTATDKTLIVGGQDVIYIYSYVNGEWIYQQAITHHYSNHGFVYNSFGSAVSCYGEDFLVGADDDCDKGTIAGASHFYKIPSLVTGVEDLNTQLSFDLYPNPFTSDFMVKWQDDKLTSCDINILSLLGKKIRTYKLTGLSEEKLEMDGEGSGMYFVEINYNGISTKKKIIKN